MSGRAAGRCRGRILVLFWVGILVWGALALGADTWPNCSFNCTAKDVALVSMYAVVSGGSCEPGGTSSAEIYERFTASAKRYAIILIADLHVEGGSTEHLMQCVGDLSAGTTNVLLTTVTWPCGSAITLGNITVSWSTNQETCADAKCAGRGAQCSKPEDLAASTPLVVDFASNAPQCLGTAVSFTNHSTGGASPYTYQWSFGDGGTSAQANPLYTYAAAGTYTVTLTVRDRTGATDSHSHTVVVSALPTATASNDGPYCPGQTIRLSASGGTSYSWSGPDGFASTQQNPSIPSSSASKAGTYTVTVAGGAGCAAQASTIVVVDAMSPVLKLPSSVSVPCGSPTDPQATGAATAIDTHDPHPAVTYADAVNLLGCGGTGTITRTWKATDACGNAASGAQTITVVDTTPPALSVPSSLTVPCGSPTDPSATGQASATDTCSSPVVTHTDVTSLTGCSATGTIIRTWKAADACGNVATGVQTITIVDTTAPTLSIPPSVTVPCGSPTDPSATGTASATDACLSPFVTHTDVTLLSGCDGTSTIIRTWKAADACGNVATGVQTITVVDRTAPSLSVPPNLTVDCGHPTDPSATGQASATDSCSSPVVTHTDITSLTGCGGTGTIVRTWKATDACGNVATGVQTITVVDATLPTLSVPPSVTVRCGSSTDPSATGQAGATDTCSSPVVTHTDVTSLTGCGGTGTIVRTWKATDTCGNVSTGVQTITVVDTTPPALSVPAGAMVQSGQSTDPAATGQATATDDCSSPIVTYSDRTNLSGPGGIGTITRIWKAADACGNEATGLQTITVVAAPPPPILILRVPADVTVAPGDPTAPSATGSPTVSDTCATPPVVSYTDQEDLTGCDETGTITRTWKAADACGNVSTGIQTITVADTSLPVLTVPANATVDCGRPTDPSATGTATAADPHGDKDFAPTITYTDEVHLTGCGGTGTILRTWKATEACNNTSSGVQTITIVDRTPPTLTVPANVTVAAGESVDPSVTGQASATDACSSPILTYTDQEDLTGCDETGTITRMWKATDACGNVSTGIQTITVVDRSLPVLTVPADVTVDCGGATGPSATGTATAVDSHGDKDFAPTITYADQVDLIGCGGTGTITRTWTAACACGNAATGVQTITIVDRTPPVLVVPPDVTIECHHLPVPAVTGRASASDACSSPILTYTDQEDLTGCDETGTITRMWKATDVCGNVSAGIQTITVVDRSLPVLTVPADVTVDCGGATGPSATGTATAVDIHGDKDFAPTITYADQVDLIGCGGTGTITRTWTAACACGNAATGVQTITIVDRTPPTLTVPADVILDCGHAADPAVTGTATATDGCTTSPTVTYSDSSASTTCSGATPILRTWKAIDACGNVATGIQRIIPANHAPVANADTAGTPQGQSVVVPVTANDVDIDGNISPSTVVVVSGPAHGTATVDPATGNVTYTPGSNFTGADTFAYRICDTGGLCSSAQVIVTVTPVNHPPVANDETTTLPEGTPTSLVLTGMDPDGNPLTYHAVTSPSHGAIGAFDPATGHLVYTPEPGYGGLDSFQFEVCDSLGACATAKVFLTISKVDRPPVAIPQSLATDEDVALPITLQATDEEPLIYRVVSPPSHGTLLGFDPATGTLTYIPDPDYSGLDAFFFQACDPTGSCESAPVFLTVRPVNSPPVAVSTDLVVPEGLPSDLGLIAHDPEGDPLSYRIIQHPLQGTIGSFDPAIGRVTYAPNPGFRGPDAIVFQVCDPSGACAEGVVQLLIVGAGGAGGAAGATGCSVRVTISEVAWAGTAADPAHEWIELRNLGEAPVNLEGWTLRWRRNQPQTDEDRLWKAVALAGEIGPYRPDAGFELRLDDGQQGSWWVLWQPAEEGGQYLLERGTDRAVSDVPADLVYDDRLPLDRTADLDDRGEVIQLLDPLGCIVDTANADHPERDSWAAGDLATQGTMERTDLFRGDLDDNWHTNLGLWTWGTDAAGGLLLGTAHRENSPLLEDVSRALTAEPTVLVRGTPLRLTFPAAGIGQGAPRGVKAFLSTTGETGIANLDASVTALPDGLTVQIDTSGLPLGRSFLWLRYGGGDALLAPLDLTP